jgi:PAS domain S-box-containing protein
MPRPRARVDAVTGADLLRARLAAIVESSDDAIVSKTLEGIVTSWNPAAERMFGYTAAEMIGRSITAIIPPDRLGEEDQVLAAVSRGDRVDHYQTVRRRKDGGFVDVSLTVSPVRDPRGVIVGASKIARDVTAEKRAAAERERLLARERQARADAEKANRLKDEFLATLSHELRTPLTAMLGWIRMLRLPGADDAWTARALETIERNTELLHQLVQDLLDVARITTGAMRLDVRTLPLPPVIEAAVESVRPAAAARGIRLDLFLDPAVPPVSADPARLQQVVWNLVSNAIKFTPKDGRVEVHLQQRRSEAEIRVVDTGIGIAPDFLAHVFDRFSQADSSTARAHGGLGLGLAIVRHLVELHGGSVAAQSAGPGRGATFMVRLPVSALMVRPPDAPPSSAAAAPGPPRGTPRQLDGLNVLLVEDNRDAQELITAVLERYGASVTSASSVDEALGALGHAQPDVILCDISLPGRDGYTFVRDLGRRPEPVDVPVAALTAHARDEDRARALASGFTSHIGKPVDPLTLVEEVARLGAAARRRSRREPRAQEA